MGALAPHQVCTGLPAPRPGVGLYRWALDGGLCLLSGARQSAGAHALWQSLGSRYVLGYVDLRCKTLTYLGEQVSTAVQDDLHTRMLLLGHGWSLGRFREATGMY